MPTETQITKTLDRSLKSLVNLDKELFEIDVNERTLTHRLAIYLETEISAWDENWDIDCEYNRDVTSEIEPYSKKLNLREIEDLYEISVDDEHAKTVYPDIIIHQRQTQDNLIVIEVKKSTSNESYINFDRDRKLPAYKEELGYSYAIMVILHIGSNPSFQVEWI